MAKIKKMGEGIVIKDAPEHRTTMDGAAAKGRRSATNRKTPLILLLSTSLAQRNSYRQREKSSESQLSGLCSRVLVSMSAD